VLTRFDPVAHQARVKDLLLVPREKTFAPAASFRYSPDYKVPTRSAVQALSPSVAMGCLLACF